MLFFFVISSIALSAQITLKGKVYDEYLDPFPNAIINSLQSTATTTSNINGNFTLTLKKKLPYILLISAKGYRKEILKITDLKEELNIILKEIK
ncbi:carboxypeptidase-like regulatory domain-containing protein [Tenacibaculum pacificus]|uniref:carboxypeptidase-like regulatory domain-containing protein n=1 Tax=Tenacibaculum pacificus TaxID=3018314 RepID=UPI0022F3D8FD|nr:carboxypeptidase-like regulatory domain-containing protein [Tenacibaculum pacificus]WBX73614.1 carboxypeptidase-like regulatory domain-containing protein [Tenacibaculum pacificus]